MDHFSEMPQKTDKATVCFQLYVMPLSMKTRPCVAGFLSAPAAASVGNVSGETYSTTHRRPLVKLDATFLLHFIHQQHTQFLGILCISHLNLKPLQNIMLNAWNEGGTLNTTTVCARMVPESSSVANTHTHYGLQLIECRGIMH